MVDLDPRALAVLCCPHCGSALTVIDRIVGCAAGHRFDLARQGYLSLLGPRSRTDTGDSAEMVAARVDFLTAGHFAPVAAAVADAVDGTVGVVGDLGAGPGYYLTTSLGADRAGVAVDSSRYAARRAASLPRVVSVVADAWSALPVRDGSLAALLNVFAPREVREVARVLAPGGRYVAVTPEPGHLEQVREPLGMLQIDPGKADRLAESLSGLLVPVSRRAVRYEMVLDAADLAALVRMGPAARHRSVDEIADAVATLQTPVTVTASVTVSVFER